MSPTTPSATSDDPGGHRPDVPAHRDTLVLENGVVEVTSGAQPLPVLAYDFGRLAGRADGRSPASLADAWAPAARPSN